MKIQSLLIAAVAITMGLSACNKEEDLTQQDGIPANAVQITATVGNPFATTRSNPIGTVEEQAKFNSGDRILVENTTGGKVVYQFDGTNWTAENNKYLLWNSNNVNEDFSASYSLYSDEYLNGIYFDQSTLSQLALSDLMIGTITNAAKGEPLNFVMERQTSRINIKIADFNTEFPSDSKVKDIKIMIYFYNVGIYSTLTPFAQADENNIGKVGTIYTVLAGGKGIGNSIYVTLKVGSKEMRTADLPSLMEKGKSYTYNLIVGKEKLEIASVTVEDWTTGEIIPGGHAEEDKRE